MAPDFSRARRPSHLDLKDRDEFDPSIEEDEDDPERKDTRSPWERDRDKVLYSREFRRLKDVTQVARAGETYLHHDRLTHSLKVAQIGQRLSELFLEVYEDEALDLESHLDPSVVEAACLAHDIGHPPFGHLTENLLDEKVRKRSGGKESEEDPDSLEESETDVDETAEDADDDADDSDIQGFEGNAQSFRAVSALASRDDQYDGMDLTRATLNAMLKYPWARDEEIDVDEDSDDKWGYYESERKYFEFARAGTHENRNRCLEAEIMDYADDLTYAVHDVDDFYRDGLIPLDQLIRETESLVREQEASADDIEIESAVDVEIEEATESAEGSKLKAFEDYVIDETKVNIEKGDVIQFFLELILEAPGIPDELYSPYEGTEAEQESLNGVITALISRYLESPLTAPEDRDSLYLDESDADGAPTLEIAPKFKREIGILKQLTFYYVISNPTLSAQQRGEQKVISDLFEDLYKEATSGEVAESAIPTPYRERLLDLDDTEDAKRARIVADLIADLTEPQAIRFHKRLRGESPGSLQDKIIRP